MLNKVSDTEEEIVTVTQHGLRRLDYVDGLRATGALWVAAGHYAIDPGHLLPPFLKAIWLRIMGLHGVPVMVFLVLSGFCLYYPMIVKSEGASVVPPDYRTFMVRRARRLLPPFYGAVTLCVVLILSVPFMRYLNPQPLTGQAVLYHLLLLHNLVETSTHAIDYPLWSIGLEWQLYLLFPVLTWMIWCWNLKIAFFITIIVALLVRGVFQMSPGILTYALVSGPLPYCYTLLMGMYAADCTVTRRYIPKWILWSGFLLSLAVIQFKLGRAFGVTFACGSATLCVLLLAIDEKSFVHRILSMRWLAKIGVFSYSIYLLHAPILFAMLYGLSHFAMGTETKFLIFMLIGMPLMLVLAYGFFLVFEKPFIGKTRKVIRPSSAKPLRAITGS